ncbi:hypothetical protein Ancab_029018 [Ancistrocladus abbreviatus]
MRGKKAMETVSRPPTATTTTIPNSTPYTTARLEEEGSTLSCGACLRMKIPWMKSNNRRDHFVRYKNSGGSGSGGGRCGGCDVTASLCSKPKKPKPRGDFKYDPLSYAQNFDDGVLEDDDGEYYNRGFSSRFAAPPPSTARFTGH